MPFRVTFDCLWCGAPHTTRTPDDIEGWAQLCPTCIGKAGDNGFLRFRLRQAITERGQAASGSTTDPIEPTEPATGAAAAPPKAAAPSPPTATIDDDQRASDIDDWYLRRGRFALGAIQDTAWHAELDMAGRWLDAQPIRGEIVDLAAGTGWWATLLADKGELSLYDTNTAALERARERLIAHGLRAHLHPRDPWSEPDRSVDVVFCGAWLGQLAPERLGPFLALVRRWLKPAGTFVFIDALADGDASDAHGRRRTPIEVEAALAGAGFDGISVTTTGSFLVIGTASAGP
jgi:demethylmenaquinone methyltransferase/2-methoxy-6-polyprenyl-1,4-benzoquinol methylase